MKAALTINGEESRKSRNMSAILKSQVSSDQFINKLEPRDVAKVFNRWESSNNRWVLSLRPTLPCLWHAIPRGVRGHVSPGILKMHALGDAFSLILRAKLRVFRTDFYQVTSNKVMMNWSVDCFYYFFNI